MQRRTSPHPVIPVQNEGRLAADNADVIALLASRLADGSRPGVLTTIDALGKPHARLLPTIGFGDFPRLYAMIPTDGRKPGHPEQAMYVTWTFANDSQSVVVNLTGHARAVTDAALINRIWKLRAERADRLYDDHPTSGIGFILIETEVEDIECNLPRETFKTLAGLLACAETRHPVSLRRC